MIIFVHLLNDRSGSPHVLKQAISALSQIGDGSRLFVGSDGSGCLEDAAVPITRYWYRRTSNRWLTLATFLASQFFLFASLFRFHKTSANSVIYINTLFQLL